MTKAEALAELKAKRDEINRQMRELRQDGIVSTDRARIAPKQTYAYRTDELWQLSFLVPIQSHYVSGRDQYRTLFTGTRRECIEAIPEIVAELTELYKAAQEDGNGLTEC